jgi:hypothetical protein
MGYNDAAAGVVTASYLTPVGLRLGYSRSLSSTSTLLLSLSPSLSPMNLHDSSCKWSIPGTNTPIGRPPNDADCDDLAPLV